MNRALTAGRVLFLIVLLSISSLEARAQTPTARTLKLDDYLELETAADPQIAPDASRIVYTRQWVDKLNDRRASSLWIMDVDGAKNRHLTEGGSARWSPDGTRIAFVHEGQPAGAQIFVRWMDAEGSTTQITRLEQSPSNISWSPDGKSIAFTASVDDRPAFAGVNLPGRPQGARWTADPKVVERASYKRDRSGYIDTGWTHVFVVPANGAGQVRAAIADCGFDGDAQVEANSIGKRCE